MGEGVELSSVGGDQGALAAGAALASSARTMSEEDRRVGARAEAARAALDDRAKAMVGWKKRGARGARAGG